MESVEFDSQPGADPGKSVSGNDGSAGLLRIAAELHLDSHRRDRRKWSCLREKLESIKTRYTEASRRVRILSRYVE
jgi:hypothetical protein